MDETIKAMVEALEKYNAGYIKVDLGKYSLIIADKETSKFIDECLNEDEFVKKIRADERSRVIGIIATRLEKRFSGALREDEVKLLMYEIHRILEEVNSMK